MTRLQTVATNGPTHGRVPSDADARRLLAQAQTGLFVVQDGRIVYANDMLAMLLGWRVDELVGKPHEVTVTSAFQDSVRLTVERRLAGKVGRPGLMRCQRKDHSEFDAKALSRLVEFRGRAAVLVTIFDVSDLAQIVRQAQWNGSMLAHTEAMCRSGSYEITLPTGQVMLSKGLRNLLGLNDAPDSPGTLDVLTWVSPEVRHRIASAWRAAVPGRAFEFDHGVLRLDGQRMTVVHRCLVVDEPNGQPERGVALLQDITAWREAETRVRKLTTLDALTGLPNRAAFLDQLESALRSASHGVATVTVLAIEVPLIAEARGCWGFCAADTLAMALAARLQKDCAPDERIGRLSDTEFAVLLRGLDADEHAAVRRANALVELLQRPVRLDGTDAYPHVVVGVASFPDDSTESDRLLECAQKARLSSAESNNVFRFTPDSNLRAVRAKQVEAALRGAIGRDEFALKYKPRVSLADGSVIGAEATLRWNSATLGAVAPREFGEVAEQSALIGAMTDWTLQRACAQCAQWRAAGLPPVRVSIKLPATHLQRPDLAEQLQAMLSMSGTDPSWLGIELHEGTAMSAATSASSVLGDVKAMGIEISLDDFGFGYASLNRLRSLPIDLIKVDRSFVNDVTAAPQSASVTRAIINMAHSLQMRVLAEGVETEDQLSLLAANRCDLIQGPLFSRPLGANDFAALLRENRRLPERFTTRLRQARTLLLVDDEENIVAALKRLLRRDGYHIVTACGAQEALKCMAESEVDVIVSDQRMPGMTGVELLRRAKQLHPASVRMVLSGYTDLQSIIDAVNEGAIYKFLTKPWDDERLRAHVAEAFQQKQMADENRRLTQQLEHANTGYAQINARLQRTVGAQRDEFALLAARASGLRQMVDALPVPTVGLDADGTIVFANEQAQSRWPDEFPLLGRPVGEVLASAAHRPTDPPQVGLGEWGGRGHRVLSGMVPHDALGVHQILMLVPQSSPEAA